MKKNTRVLKYGGKKLYIILVYDIMLDKEENGAKILRNIFKTCKKYLHHIQNSVFEGELTNNQLIELKCELNNYIRKNKDSVILFENQSNKWMNKEVLGKQEDRTTNIL